MSIADNKENLESMDKLVEAIRSIGVSTSRDNANVGNNFSSKLLQIASASNKAVMQMDLPYEIKLAYVTGLIHIHDLDSYNLTINCLNIDTKKALEGGFNTGYGTINRPKRIGSAAELSCILLQSTQNDMFGGQSHYDFDNDMAIYIELTEIEIFKETNHILDTLKCEDGLLGDVCKYGSEYENLIQKKLIKAVKQAMQSVIYNLNSMHSRAGSQIPFSSVNIGIPKNKYAAMACKYFLLAYNEGLGKGEQPIFPNIIFRVKDGVNKKPGDPYYDLFKLACKVAGDRMNPTFLNCDATMNLPHYLEGVLPATMGCRTSVMDNVNGPSTPKGRGNIAPVSMNLVKLALESKKEAEDTDKEILAVTQVKLRELLELSERQLLHRYNTLKVLKGKDLPFIVGQDLIMGAEKVGKEDSIDPVLKNGTWGIGFVGLAEALKVITGKHHGEDIDVWKIGYNLIKMIRNFCDEATKRNKLNFACYATPAEGLSGRFVEIDKQVYGKIKGVTDKGYYTNSFHIPVEYSISITDKLKLEAPFHKLCNAGHISYIELDGPVVDDDTLIERIVRYAFTETDAGYIGVNFAICYCKECGEKHIRGNICPKCKSTNLQHISRVTGYLSLDERFGSGKAAEKKARKCHNVSL